jgi:hypothetical protein
MEFPAAAQLSLREKPVVWTIVNVSFVYGE